MTPPLLTPKKRLARLWRLVRCERVAVVPPPPMVVVPTVWLPLRAPDVMSLTKGAMRGFNEGRHAQMRATLTSMLDQAAAPELSKVGSVLLEMMIRKCSRMMLAMQALLGVSLCVFLLG